MQHDIRWRHDGAYTRAYLGDLEVAWIYTEGSGVLVSYWSRGPPTKPPASHTDAALHHARFRCRKGVSDTHDGAIVIVERLIHQMWNQQPAPGPQDT